MRKILTLVIMMISILLTNTVSVNALSIEDKEVEEFVQALLPVMPEWQNSKLKKGDKLYGEGHIEIGYIYRFFDDKVQNGYIVYLDGIGVIEATWEGEDRAKDMSGSVYYAPPGRFYTRKEFDELVESTIEQEVVSVGANVYNITGYTTIPGSGTQVSATPYTDLTFDSTKVPSLSSNVDTISGPYVIRKKIQDIPDYTWYEGCAPTAAGNMIAYYDNEVHNDLSYYDTYGSDFTVTANSSTASNSLIYDLSVYFETNSSGESFEWVMSMGLEDYLADYNHDEYVVMTAGLSDDYIFNWDVNTSFYRSLINTGNPSIITMYSHPTYNSHAVTGIGYIMASPDIYGVIVHDTWSPSTSKEIYLSYEGLSSFYFIYEI